MIRTLNLALALAVLPLPAMPQPRPARTTVDQLHVLDCGTAASPDFSQWSPGNNQGKPVVMRDHCYLIRHGRNWMLWDTGVDDRLAGLPRGKEVAHKVRGVAGRGLEMQLRQHGIAPSEVTVIALSHAHFDHTGNARLFTRARWYVQRSEYHAMFGRNFGKYGFVPALYQTLKRNPVTLLDGDRDVFGDGSVRIISTPGHTPGHQSLLVRTPSDGVVLLSGDIAHSRENFELRRVPTFNADPVATRRSIEKVETLLKRESARIWINHDANPREDNSGR